LRPFDARRFEKHTPPFDARPNDSLAAARDEPTRSREAAVFSMIIAALQLIAYLRHSPESHSATIAYVATHQSDAQDGLALIYYGSHPV